MSVLGLIMTVRKQAKISKMREIDIIEIRQQKTELLFQDSEQSTIRLNVWRKTNTKQKRDRESVVLLRIIQRVFWKEIKKFHKQTKNL